MHRFWLRLLLVLPLASIVSVVVGFAAGWLATMMSCQGEVLACNIGEAIGAYEVLIWALLGPIVFGVTLTDCTQSRCAAGRDAGAPHAACDLLRHHNL